jgi:hypothetical protein
VFRSNSLLAGMVPEWNRPRFEAGRALRPN